MSSRHRDFLPIALGTFALVIFYGLVNDQAIVAIAPGHFSLFQPHYFPVQQPWAQALCFAAVVAGGAGLLWGILLYWVGHYGPGPVTSPRASLLRGVVVLRLTAAAAWGLGWRAHHTGHVPYPQFFYPTESKDILITQTVQLTNELVGLLGAFAWLFAIAIFRKIKA
ncbi:MAG: hypothetical protein ABSH19_02750 [Opitutales bacterium]